jgi:polysaccharide pyruvyl transferase WcaK-like protein
MDKLVFFSDFAANHTNRGCQALNYGSFHFMRCVLGIDNASIISPGFYYRKRKSDEIHILQLSVDENIKVTRRFYWAPEIIITSILYKIFGGKIGMGKFYKDLMNVDYILNISGGDGFSDIYSTKTFRHLFWPSLIGAFLNRKLILLPQTIGPFKKNKNRILADFAIRKAEQVFVRDLVYAEQLKKLNVAYQLTNDVSYYMKPKDVIINIETNAVGINISGLAYFNNFKDLKGRFPYYKELIVNIIEFFQELKVPIYLVPHTYNHESPEINADDLQASKDLFHLLKNNSGIKIIDADYIAPELKYIISKFDFFIGTRLHANFAAIYSHVPVFGLAYSYKFSGSFNQYGLEENYASVIDMKKEHIQEIVQKIGKCYIEREITKEKLIDLLNKK